MAPDDKGQDPEVQVPDLESRVDETGINEVEATTSETSFKENDAPLGADEEPLHDSEVNDLDQKEEEDHQQDGQPDNQGETTTDAGANGPGKGQEGPVWSIDGMLDQALAIRKALGIDATHFFRVWMDWQYTKYLRKEDSKPFKLDNALDFWYKFACPAWQERSAALADALVKHDPNDSDALSVIEHLWKGTKDPSDVNLGDVRPETFRVYLRAIWRDEVRDNETISVKMGQAYENAWDNFFSAVVNIRTPSRDDYDESQPETALPIPNDQRDWNLDICERQWIRDKFFPWLKAHEQQGWDFRTGYPMAQETPRPTIAPKHGGSFPQPQGQKVVAMDEEEGPNPWDCLGLNPSTFIDGEPRMVHREFEIMLVNDWHDRLERAQKQAKLHAHPDELGKGNANTKGSDDIAEEDKPAELPYTHGQIDLAFNRLERQKSDRLDVFTIFDYVIKWALYEVSYTSWNPNTRRRTKGVYYPMDGNVPQDGAEKGKPLKREVPEPQPMWSVNARMTPINAPMNVEWLKVSKNEKAKAKAAKAKQASEAGLAPEAEEAEEAEEAPRPDTSKWDPRAYGKPTDAPKGNSSGEKPKFNERGGSREQGTSSKSHERQKETPKKPSPSSFNWRGSDAGSASGTKPSGNAGKGDSRKEVPRYKPKTSGLYASNFAPKDARPAEHCSADEADPEDSPVPTPQQDEEEEEEAVDQYSCPYGNHEFIVSNSQGQIHDACSVIEGWNFQWPEGIARFKFRREW